MSQKIARRRLFGLVGALAAVAAVPPAAAAAAPMLDPSIAPHPMLGEIADLSAYGQAVRAGHVHEIFDGRVQPASGGYVTANHAQVMTFEQNGCLIPVEMSTSGVRGGEVHVTITADTSQFEAQLARLEARQAALRRMA